MIKVWHSYSCNNSSAYRLIARFADSSTANAAAAELTEFFQANPDTALRTLATTYGADWRDDSARVSDPEVFVEHEVLVVYHSYCVGLGPGVPAYLRDRGAIVDEESVMSLQLSALVPLATVERARVDELEAVFTPIVGLARGLTAWKAPWAKERASGSAAWFRDARTAGLYFPTVPDDIAAFKAWLAERGFVDPAIRIDDSDGALFDAIAAARCTSCDGRLDYLDPRLHDIETPQLVCKACGGLYDIDTFR